MSYTLATFEQAVAMVINGKSMSSNLVYRGSQLFTLASAVHEEASLTSQLISAYSAELSDRT